MSCAIDWLVFNYTAVNLSFDVSINASTFDPEDSGSDFEDELPILGKVA